MSTILFGAGPEILERITRPEVGLAVWNRKIPSELDNCLGRTKPEALPQGRVLAPAHEIVPALRELLQAGASDAGACLLAEVADLAIRFCMIAHAPAIDVRLDLIKGDACWKFHRDNVPMRLVTTYLGPGTQWVMPVDADEALAAQRDYAGETHQLATGAVAVFKGGQSPNGRGIVHRSPPIAGSNRHRYLCVIDTEGPASPRMWHSA